jgi:anti-sigma regulatory factor (Ser/Thr protein kinase)
MMRKKNTPTANTRFLISEPIDLKIAITQTLNWQPLLGVSSVDKSLIATIVSELASNIIKYATTGYLELRCYESPGNVEIEILATDNGPGIVNLKLAMQEHFSSGGTLGLGLSGVKRIADDFEILSDVGQGTQVFASKNIKTYATQPVLPLESVFNYSSSDKLASLRNKTLEEPVSTKNFEIGNHTRAYLGEIVCGDQVLAVPLKSGYLLAIIDATGHGSKAHNMALKLMASIKTSASENLSAMMSDLYELAKGQIGASLGLAFFDTNSQIVNYAGIGNTGIVVFNGKKWHGISRDGVLGQRLPNFLEQSTTFKPGDMAIMYSDGLSESSITDLALKLRFQEANTIAYRLVDVLGKTYDDASCIVLKWNK